MNKNILLLLLAAAPLTAAAQEGQYRYADATQLWRLTDNAAGLSHDSTQNRGYAQFTFTHREGDYSRVQEGNRSNQLEFQTERYQRINPVLYGYGSFRFDMDRTFNRSWADAMRPYNANPFMPASSIRSKYDGQAFDFTAAVGTIQMWGLTAGLRLDYKVGDLSRLRDPRSRSELLDYKLAPSLTYTSGQHTWGLKGHYNRRKEKIPNVSGLTDAPAITYYQLSGMEEADATVDGYKSFGREWVDHRLGAALSYNYHKGRLNSLSTIGIERGKESILEAEKREPGKYTSYEYSFATRNRIKSGRLLHEADVTIDYGQGYADEYKQQRIQTNDPETGLASYHYETLIEYRKRYQVKQFNGQLRYRLNFTDRQQAVAQYLGLSVRANSTENKHLLPTSSLEYGSVDFALEGGSVALSDHLWLDLLAGYHLSTKADLQLADPTTPVAQQVLMSDRLYYDANYWRARLQLSYHFPLKLKGYRSNWFVRAFYEPVTAQHSLSNSTLGVSIGLYN